MTFRKSIMVLAATSVFIGVQPMGSQNLFAQAAESTSDISVAVEKIGKISFVRSFSATGNVVAQQLVSVSALSNGLIIREVLAKEGDSVKAGQVLARLNTDLLEAQIAEQKASIAGKQAALDVALAAADRAQKLNESKAIATETFEQRMSTLTTSKADLVQAQAALQSLDVQLKQATITAPVSGVIAETPTAVGTVSTTTTPIFKIIQDGQLEVQAQVPQQYLSFIKAGQKVLIADTSAKSSAAGFTGSVRAVAETVDSTTRLGIVYIDIDHDKEVKSGMFARVSFELAAEDSLVIPEAALVWQTAGPGVYVISPDNKSTFKAVTTGARSNGMVVVTSGISEGETIVTEGGAFLTDGQSVVVANAVEGKTK